METVTLPRRKYDNLKRRHWDCVDMIRQAERELVAAEASEHKLREALREHLGMNSLANDRDAYLCDLALWGLGKVERRPSRGDYGLSEPPEGE